MFFKKSKKGEPREPVRRKRKTERQEGLAWYLETSRFVTVLLFVLTAMVIGWLSFIGVTTAGPPLQPNQIVPMRVVANHEFSYISPLRTERQRNQVARRVPPAFRVDMEAYHGFSDRIRNLLDDINTLARNVEEMTGEDKAAAVDAFVREYNQTQGRRINREDVSILLEQTDSATRQILFENGLVALREIHREGIYQPGDIHLEGETPDRFSLISLIRADGQVTEKAIQTEEQALQFLRINIIAPNVSQEVSIAMYRLFRPGIVPNIFFDSAKTEELRQRMVENVEPVRVLVEEGQSIVEPGTLLGPEQHEMLNQYRNHLAEIRQSGFGFNELVYHRLLLVLAVMLGSVVFIRLEDRQSVRSNVRLALLALVACANLGLIWLVINLSNHPLVLENTDWAAAVTYFAPYALSPLIVAVLVGLRPALFMALFVSIFAAIMFGNRVETFAVSLLSGLCAIWACQQVRLRQTVVKAGLFAGAVVAVSALFFGFAGSFDPMTVLRQMGAGLGMGLLTGVTVAGLLPVLEKVFRRTTDITLLELTDTNHPLLKRMQLTAPGTYHHSLVVANLSENAAAAIGANGLVCRVCSIFHDIGKLIKPEFFIENQRDGINPHADRSPSFSALVIKSHVKDGVDLAIKHKLPRIIIDVIRQHHGTSLIQYFFHQAKQRELKESESGGTGQTRIEADKVSESTYRYDGPKPQFRESAIVLFADSVEAASRTLRKITPQSIEELIDKLINDRIDDGQLDECPLTLQEVSLIKKSFAYTTLNMLHSRVDYPDDGKAAAKAADEKRKKDAPAEPVSGS